MHNASYSHGLIQLECILPVNAQKPPGQQHDHWYWTAVKGHIDCWYTTLSPNVLTHHEPNAPCAAASTRQSLPPTKPQNNITSAVSASAMSRDSRKSRKSRKPWCSSKAVILPKCRVFLLKCRGFTFFYKNTLFLISISWSLFYDFNTKIITFVFASATKVHVLC